MEESKAGGSSPVKCGAPQLYLDSVESTEVLTPLVSGG